MRNDTMSLSLFRTLEIASRAAYRLVDATRLHTGKRSRGCIHIRCRRRETTAPAATDLTTFSARRSRFVRCPFVSRPFFMGSSATFARNLPLLLGGHRCETTTFFSDSVHGTPPVMSSAVPIAQQPRCGRASRCVPLARQASAAATSCAYRVSYAVWSGNDAVSGADAESYS